MKREKIEQIYIFFYVDILGSGESFNIVYVGIVGIGTFSVSCYVDIIDSDEFFILVYMFCRHNWYW